MTPRAATAHTRPPDVMRGVAGGILLGVPLLYTQEIWDHGATMHPATALMLLGVLFAMSVALAYYVGFRPGRTHHPFEDALVGAGLSIVLATGLLFLLDRIDLTNPAENTAGIIALVAIPIGIGFAIGNALVPKQGGSGSERMTGEAGDLAAAAGGAILLALNIAPTEEPILLAQEVGWIRLTLIVALSLALPYLLVFYAEFGGRERRAASDGATQGPLVETLLAYVVAFGFSALMLWSFGRFAGTTPSVLAQIVVLSFPAALGAALGRMLV